MNNKLNTTSIYELFVRMIRESGADAVNSVSIETASSDELKLRVVGVRSSYEQEALITFKLPLKEGESNPLMIEIARGDLHAGNPWVNRGAWRTLHTLESYFRVAPFQPDESLFSTVDDIVNFLNEFFNEHGAPTKNHFGDR